MRQLARLVLVFALPAACSPSAPTPIQYNPPPPPPTPVVTRVSPTVGSADGGAPLKIDGTGFVVGSIVRVGGVAINAIFWDGSLYVTTLPHAAGVVDVEVDNAGPRGVLAGAYTFVDPDQLDFNGTWRGYFGESDLEVRLTVESGIVTAVACGGVNLELSQPPTINRGRFSYAGTGIRVSGRIVSPNEAGGAITVPSCVDPFGGDWWWAVKDGAPSSARRRR